MHSGKCVPQRMRCSRAYYSGSYGHFGTCLLSTTSGQLLPMVFIGCRFFLAFSLAMIAMRVLIAWIYANTKSVLLAQLMHVSSTGALVIFSAAHVTAMQEAMWYALYGTVLWVVVGIVVKAFGRPLELNFRRLRNSHQFRYRIPSSAPLRCAQACGARKKGIFFSRTQDLCAKNAQRPGLRSFVPAGTGAFHDWSSRLAEII
jgi:hypothetical protein